MKNKIKQARNQLSWFTCLRVKMSCPCSPVGYGKQTTSPGHGHTLNTQYIHSFKKIFQPGANSMLLSPEFCRLCLSVYFFIFSFFPDYSFCELFHGYVCWVKFKLPSATRCLAIILIGFKKHSYSPLRC